MGEGSRAQARRARKGQRETPEGSRTIKPSVHLAFVLLILLGARCASGPSPAEHFNPADQAFAVRALAAWEEAARRADSLPPSRLLYDAKFQRGAVTAPGTLAVFVRSASLRANATGPLGGEMGRYENGTLTGKSGETYFLDPDLLRGVLSGMWPGGPPLVAGANGEKGLLRWETAESVAEGILDLPGARLTQLSVRGRPGELRAEFAGACDPWPERVSLWDVKAGRSLKLRRLAAEPLDD